MMIVRRLRISEETLLEAYLKEAEELVEGASDEELTELENEILTHIKSLLLCS